MRAGAKKHERLIACPKNAGDFACFFKMITLIA